MGTGTGVETETTAVAGDGNGDGNEDGIVENGGGAKKRKKPHKNCRRDQALLFRTRHHLCRQGVALAGTWKLRLQCPMHVHAHHTKGVTGFEGREGANGVEGGIGVRGGNRGVNGNGDEDGAGTRTGVEANERTQDGNGDGSADGAVRGTGRERRRGGLGCNKFVPVLEGDGTNIAPPRGLI